MTHEKIICSFFSKKNWQKFRLKVKLIVTDPVPLYAFCGGGSIFLIPFKNWESRKHQTKDAFKWAAFIAGCNSG
jgi:hypothetical protein